MISEEGVRQGCRICTSWLRIDRSQRPMHLRRMESQQRITRRSVKSASPTFGQEVTHLRLALGLDIFAPVIVVQKG